MAEATETNTEDLASFLEEVANGEQAAEQAPADVLEGAGEEPHFAPEQDLSDEDSDIQPPDFPATQEEIAEDMLAVRLEPAKGRSPAVENHGRRHHEGRDDAMEQTDIVPLKAGLALALRHPVILE